jgi:hypothetical protein
VNVRVVAKLKVLGLGRCHVHATGCMRPGWNDFSLALYIDEIQPVVV